MMFVTMARALAVALVLAALVVPARTLSSAPAVMTLAAACAATGTGRAARIGTAPSAADAPAPTGATAWATARASAVTRWIAGATPAIRRRSQGGHLKLDEQVLARRGDLGSAAGSVRPGANL